MGNLQTRCDKSEPRNAQGRRALEIRRTTHKDYADKKRTEREARRKQRDEAIFHPAEVRAMLNCGLNSCLTCICYFSCKLITRRPKNEEKYCRMKNKY